MKSSKAAREERERLLRLKHKLDNRITVVKFGKQSLDAGDYGSSIKKFVDYLAVIAEAKEVSGIYAIRVNHFNPQKDLTEMLMISHIYFEMARMYDAVPKFHDESKKCLEQFVHFSVNQPYQVVNSEMIRKFLKKSLFKNPEAFRFAYQQIYVQSKKCYVVTFCYGDSHPVTQEFRNFKDWLLERSWGHTLVRYYYAYSSVAVEKYGNSNLFQYFSHWIVRPALSLLSKTFIRVIINK